MAEQAEKVPEEAGNLVSVRLPLSDRFTLQNFYAPDSPVRCTSADYVEISVQLKYYNFPFQVAQKMVEDLRAIIKEKISVIILFRKPKADLT